MPIMSFDLVSLVQEKTASVACRALHTVSFSANLSYHDAVLVTESQFSSLLTMAVAVTA